MIIGWKVMSNENCCKTYETPYVCRFHGNFEENCLCCHGNFFLVDEMHVVYNMIINRLYLLLTIN
jgi:hypothetical protein